MKAPWSSLALLALMTSAPAAGEDFRNTIRVRAVGEAAAPADLLLLRLSVATRHADPQQAKDSNDRITARIYDLADSQGLSRPTLLATTMRFDFSPGQSGKQGKAQQQLDPFSQAPQRDPLGAPPAPEAPIQMSREIEVRFEQLPQAVRFLAEVTTWDSVHATRELRLSPLSFHVADPRERQREARRRAVAAAKEKAQLLAEENSLRLGDAVQVFDESFHASRSAHADDPFGDLFSDVPAPRAEGAPGRGALAAPAPDVERPGQRLNLDQLAPGQVAFSATVTVVYELAKP